jgi:Uma2 family endonuclease
LTPEQFERVCQANPEAVLELAADGTLIVMTPMGGEDTSSRNGSLLYQPQDFCRQHKPWHLFHGSTGFRLSNGSVLGYRDRRLSKSQFGNGAQLVCHRAPSCAVPADLEDPGGRAGS